MVANVYNNMCDLLAYHTMLSVSTLSNVNATLYNASQVLLTLLEANVQDTCTWVRLHTTLNICVHMFNGT